MYKKFLKIFLWVFYILFIYIYFSYLVTRKDSIYFISVPFYIVGLFHFCLDFLYIYIYIYFVFIFLYFSLVDFIRRPQISAIYHSFPTLLYLWIYLFCSSGIWRWSAVAARKWVANGTWRIRSRDGKSSEFCICYKIYFLDAI